MDSLITVRTISPVLPGNIIRRGRLLEKLSYNSDKCLILITSPAGYGKTTLIQDWLAHSKADFAWLRISADMDNFYIFVNYIITSLRNINKDFGRNTEKVIEICREKYQLTKNQKTIINDITGTLINEFYQFFKNDL